MAKASKVAKKAPKTSKSPTKKAPAKTTAKSGASKAAKPKTAVKAAEKATTKIAAKAKSIVAAVAKALPKPEKAKKEKAPAKAAGKPGRKGKKKDELELDDDLLAGDEDLGSEEIPDLADFEEDEEEEIVEEEEVTDDEGTVVAESKPAADEEIYLTDAEGRRYCRVRDCDQAATVETYCRYHYLLLWKRIQVRRKILVDGKLERYVEELTSRYPDKFLEMIRKDLRNEKDFLSAIAELEIDDSGAENELEDEAQSYIDEVRGMTTESGIQDEEDF